MGDTVDTADTDTVTDTSASVPLMPNPKPSPKPKPPLLPNPKLKPMPMPATDTAVLMDTMVDTTVIPDTVITVIITASVPLNPKPTTDTVDTDMAVMVIMVNFAQDQVTRISNTPRKSGPKKKKIIFNLQPPQNSLLFPFL